MNLKELFNGSKQPTIKALHDGKNAAKKSLQEAKDRIQNLETDLGEARFQEYVGGKSNAKKIESELYSLKNEIQVLELAIQKFDEKIFSARQNEISKRIPQIQKKIEALQGGETDRIDQFLEAAGKAAGLFANVSDLPSFRAGGHPNIPDGAGWRFPDLVRWGIPYADIHAKKGEIARRKKIFIDAFFQVNDGDPSIKEHIRKLYDELHKLKKENSQVSA